MFPKVTNIYFHYSGYATISKSSPSKAGWWKVGKDEFMLIDDLVKLFSIHASMQRNLKLSIYADTPGASGLFHRLIEQLNQDVLKIDTNLK